ncbi:MAG: hypothetical protein IT177_14395 [Acidobacteria bacterium]|nr:hypothetical protein [Acidobacteriota bacterium]
MELGLQFGYGMMDHCRSLIAAWGGGTAVLSPRDLNGDQLKRLAVSLKALPNARVLVDPQVYLPHSDHERLCSHDYWPRDYQTGAFWVGTGLSHLVDRLCALNDELGSSAFIVPGLLAQRIDDDWLATQRLVLEEASSKAQRPIFMTLALGADAVKDQDQITQLLDAAADWKPDGYYLVCEHPGGKYLVDDPDWLANVLDLVAGLKLLNRYVMLGYCNQQMLIAASAKADAICSGTWMNVRSFPPDKFRTQYDDEVRQRATWYYCPQALSEYKIPFLDIAHRLKMLNRMGPPPILGSSYADGLFTGAKPSTVGFTEQNAFRHFLQCLHSQAAAAAQPTFDDTVAEHERTLNEAEDVLRALAAGNVRGQLRDFAELVDVNRAALGILGATRGPMLRRRWAQL